MFIKEVDLAESESDPDCEKLERKDQLVKITEHDARIERVAKRAFVGAGARVLFYPTLLYNVVRNKLESEFRWWDEVDQFVLLGAVPFPKDVQRLKELGVRGVVTLNEPYETLVPTSLYQEHGIKHLVIPTRDYLFAPLYDDIRRAVEFIHENAICGKMTYVHCKAGRGRSTTIVLCYLVEYKQMTPAGAYEYVRSKRPRVLLAASQWQAVQEYEKRRNGSQTRLTFPAGLSLPDQSPMMPIYISRMLYKSNITTDIGDRDIHYDDSIVIVTSADLEGYRSIKDAGLIGNQFWKELGVTYRVRFVAARGATRRKGDTMSSGEEDSTRSSSKAATRRSRYSLKSITFFGVELSPDNIAVAMVYFVQGVLGIARLAVSFYLKDDLHLDPAETAVISGFSALPWLIKPLYGFISDSFPLFGYRRRSYLVLSGLLGAFSWTLMASYVDSKYDAAFCILLGSFSVAFSDVVVDSMVVERARGESQSMAGSLQSLCWGSSAFGGIVSAYFSGSLVDAYGVRFVFGVTALLPLITSAVAALVNEQRVHGPARGQNLSISSPGFLESSKNSIVQLWDAVKQPSVLFPTLFVFLWQATPHSESAMFFFTTNKLGFTPEFLGRVKLVTSVASLLGVGLYNGFLKNVPLRKIFLITTIFGTALGMTQVVLVTGLNRTLNISDEWFAIGDSLIITVLGQASFMPVLVLAARICPEGMEATLFATLMSISNGGSVLGGLIGAGLTQLLGVTKDRFDNLALLIILCNLSSLLPLPLLGLLPKDEPNASSKATDGDDIEVKSN